MSLVIYEPFEFWPPLSGYMWDCKAIYQANILASGISGMDGRCLAIGPNNTDTSWVRWYLPTDLSEVFLTFLYRPTGTYTGGNEMLFFRDASGNVLGGILRNVDGILRAYAGWGVTLLGSSSSTLANNTTYRIDIQYKPHDTNGVFKVWFGAPDAIPTLEIDFAGDTTAYAANVHEIRVGEQGGHTDIAWYGYLDCFAVDDAAIPGLIKAKVLLPNAAGYIGEFSQLPNSGSPYDKVDDQGNKGDGINWADAIYATAADKTHSFDPTALNTTGIDVIVAVKPVALVKCDGFPAPHNVKVGLRSGGSNYFTDDIPVTPPVFADQGTWETRVCSKLWLLDPADNNAWTIAKADALEMVVQSVT